jgi:hypothetical protein
VILGEQGSWAPIHMHQMDFQCCPQGCRWMSGFCLPTRRITHGGSPYPLGRTHGQRGRGHLGPADLHLVLVGGGLSRLWAGWQATRIIVQPRHSLCLAAHAVPGSWARLNQGGKPGQRAVAKYVRGFCRTIRFLGKIQKSDVRNSMTYRLPNSRKSNFATELSCVRNRITSWERATSMNSGGTIRLIGWPSALSDLSIGSISNQWQQPRRKKFSRQATLP